MNITTTLDPISLNDAPKNPLLLLRDGDLDIYFESGENMLVTLLPLSPHQSLTTGVVQITLSSSKSRQVAYPSRFSLTWHGLHVGSMS